MIETEIQSIAEQIGKLKAQLEILQKVQREMDGKPVAKRRRSPPVQPVVLNIMEHVAALGATSTEVDEAVRLTIPSVAKDTVGSILSRLKSDGALVYDGERYFIKRFAPRPFDDGLRAVS